MQPVVQKCTVRVQGRHFEKVWPQRSAETDWTHRTLGTSQAHLHGQSSGAGAPPAVGKAPLFRALRLCSLASLEGHPWHPPAGGSRGVDACRGGHPLGRRTTSSPVLRRWPSSLHCDLRGPRRRNAATGVRTDPRLLGTRLPHASSGHGHLRRCSQILVDSDFHCKRAGPVMPGRTLACRTLGQPWSPSKPQP